MPDPEIRRLDLGADRWADVRGLHTFRHRDKRKFSAVTATAYGEGDLGDGITAGIDAAIGLLVVAWNLTDETGTPLPLPKDQPAVLDDLDLEASAVLSDAANEVMAAFNGRKVSPKDPDPDSPTGSSSD